MTPFRHGKKEAGFTLVELVLIIVILGILAVFAVPRMADTTAAKAAAAARKLQSDIAYAQELAMTRNVRYRVYVNAAPAPAAGYAVTDSAGNPAPDPAGGNLSVTLNSGSYAGITISGGFSGSFIEFNTLGVPYNSGGAPLGAASTLTVNANAAPERTVTIQPQTGKVSSP
jgi:Tfp pilus assembly protein FimT